MDRGFSSITVAVADRLGHSVLTTPKYQYFNMAGLFLIHTMYLSWAVSVLLSCFLSSLTKYSMPCDLWHGLDSLLDLVFQNIAREKPKDFRS